MRVMKVMKMTLLNDFFHFILLINSPGVRKQIIAKVCNMSCDVYLKLTVESNIFGLINVGALQFVLCQHLMFYCLQYNSAAFKI